MPGTSKAYVKIKLSERAAHHKLSEPHQGLSEFVTENITQPIKAVSNSIVPSSSLSKESPGSTSKTPGSAAKRTRRKGWQSLKQLCSSPAAFSPAGSKSASSMKSASPFLPQSKNLDIARVMPTVLQAGLKYSTPTSEIGGEFCIKTKSMLELSEGDAGPDRILNLSNSSGVAATGLRSDTEITILNSKRVDKFICSEKKVAHTENLLQLSDASRIAMIVEDSVLKQKSIIHHTNADAAMLKRLSTPVSASKHSARDTISATETQFNLPCIASLSDSANVAPISNSQGLRTSEDETCNSNSANFVEDSSIPVMVKSSDEQEKSSPIDKDVITQNSSLIKAVLQKRRQHDDDDNGCNVPPEADEASLHDWDLYLQQTSSIDPSSIKKNVNAQISACERKASRPRAKKKPLFRRFGHHWFTICKSSKRLNWRII